MIEYAAVAAMVLCAGALGYITHWWVHAPRQFDELERYKAGFLRANAKLGVALIHLEEIAFIAQQAGKEAGEE